ncbi:MAG: thiosulfate oxidation carrier complex protein SoxZ [Steroidobacteraceae bacterium]
MSGARVLINAPATAVAGEVIEIRTLIAHVMETGHRMGAQGEVIPRNIINRFACRYDGAEVFTADLFPAIAANPFIAFTVVATRSGTLAFEWTDDQGTIETAAHSLIVT